MIDHKQVSACHESWFLARLASIQFNNTMSNLNSKRLSLLEPIVQTDLYPEQRIFTNSF